ncbi:MAG: hypothetical protein H0U98_06200, partial [Alphaproteobacteria bacterium]|nr:hypothetical protein [Alphaproteobacteria bacterium]
MQAAANIWSQYLTLANVTLKIAITVNDAYFSGNVLAQGGPELYQQTGATFNGKPVYDTNTAIKLRTGTDINGSAPDISIELTSNAIRNLLSFKTDDSTSATPGRSDALSVFLHEIGHGLGILDASEGGGFPGYGVYDTFVQNGKFTGPNAEAAASNLAGIPLQQGSLSHISEASSYADDLMSAAIPNGTNVHISAIDLGILQDIGVAIRTGTTGDDDAYALWGTALHLNAGNDIGHAVAGGSVIYGEDGNDTLYGNTGADSLNGGDGDDTLIGGGGGDQINGGNGIDTAVYSASAGNYQVTQ